MFLGWLQRVRGSAGPASELQRSKVDDSFTPWRTRWQTLTTVSHSGDPEARSRRQFNIFGVLEANGGKMTKASHPGDLETRSRRQFNILECRGANIDDSFTFWRSGEQHLATVLHSGDPDGGTTVSHSGDLGPWGQRWGTACHTGECKAGARGVAVQGRDDKVLARRQPHP